MTATLGLSRPTRLQAAQRGRQSRCLDAAAPPAAAAAPLPRHRQRCCRLPLTLWLSCLRHPEQRQRQQQCQGRLGQNRTSARCRWPQQPRMLAGQGPQCSQSAHQLGGVRPPPAAAWPASTRQRPQLGQLQQVALLAAAAQAGGVEAAAPAARSLPYRCRWCRQRPRGAGRCVAQRLGCVGP